METVSIYEAKARFSQLVDKAAAGEDVIVSRHGKPIVRITRLAETTPRVRFGVLAGRVRISDDFDAPLSDEVLAQYCLFRGIRRPDLLATSDLARGD